MPDLKEIFHQLVEDAKAATQGTDKSVAEAIGLRHQSIRNAKVPGKPDMVSWDKLVALMDIAGWTKADRDELETAWLEFRLERASDGGVGLMFYKKLANVLNRAELRRVIRDAVKAKNEPRP